MNPTDACLMVIHLLAFAERTGINLERHEDWKYHSRVSPSV
jgi:hypothetical protein